MASLNPIFANSKKAAQLFDMTEPEFLGHVAAGHLPPARMIGKQARWDVEEMQRIARGESTEEPMTWG